MAMFVSILFLLVLPLSSVSAEVVSLPFHGNSRAYLQVHWILQSNDGGRRNITVRHSSFRDAQVLWRVNDVIVSATSPGFVISNTKFEHVNIHDRKTVKMTSLLIPASVVVDSLQLHLIMDVNEVVLRINLPDMEDDTTRLEYVPAFHLTMKNSEHIQYTVNDTLRLLTAFNSEILNESRFIRTAAEFINIDSCLTPLKVKVRNTKKNRDFMRLTTPTRSDLWDNYSWRNKLDDPNYKSKYVEFRSTSDGFWGLLKVTSGLVARGSCKFFGGVKVTRTAFLRPPTHNDFFTNRATVFLNPKSEFNVVKGQNLDVVIAAIGGYEKDWVSNPEKEYPEVKLYKNRRAVNGTERIDITRLFQREVIFRFRNVTRAQSGNYLVKAKVRRRRALHNFNIVVSDVC